MKPATRAVPAAILALLSCCGTLRPATLPPGFVETPVADGITGATALEIAPDGRLFVCEQTGALRVVKGGRLLPEPFVTVTVDSSWERGLLGVAFDPHFADNRYVYLCYIAPRPYPHHRVSRFRARGDRAEPGSEVVLFEGDNQEKLGGGVKNGHQGGALHFGRDGKLYLAIGDQTAGAPAQDMKSLLGKILRINPDGTIPEDNPFYRTTTGKYRAVWALGLRNPFTFAFQPGTGRMFINDVGGANEEVNEGFAGANYGWPTADHGPTSDRRFRGPVHWYKESSIAGGAFYNPAREQFPPQYRGKYFFADFKQGWIRVLDPDRPRKATDFLTGLGNFSVVDLKVADDGSLYYLRRKAWVKDKDFRPGTGVLYRVRYTGKEVPPTVLTGPADQAVLPGGAALFRVPATGNPALRYRWQRDGADLPGATSPTLLLPRVTAADGGSRFRCVVSNAFGRAVSAPALLTVLPTCEEITSKAFGGLFIQPHPGRYTGPVVVRVSSRLPHTSARYTTDGSAPAARSPRFDRPLPLKTSTTLAFQLFEDGRPRGKVVKAAFAIEGSTPYALPDGVPAPAVKMPPAAEDAPARLSLTGVFASLRDLTPAPGLVPYDVNTPLWSDGASKRRWIALPAGGQVGFAPTGEWSFPAGTVFVKHFELAVDETDLRKKRRLETRLLVVDGTGYGYGVTYRWRPDNTDADLLRTAQHEDVTIHTATGKRNQRWDYPSPSDCLACHTPAAKFVLGVKTRQLNRAFTYPATGRGDNQLRTWNYLGLFRPALDEAKIAAYPRLVAVDDRRAPLEARVRSYLDANCAHCHRPGNLLRAAFDARYDTMLSAQGLVNVPTVSDSLGLIDPKVIAPHDPARSMAYRRMQRSDAYRMPPLARNVPDRAALAVLEEWIRGLPPGRPRKRGR